MGSCRMLPVDEWLNSYLDPEEAAGETVGRPHFPISIAVSDF